MMNAQEYMRHVLDLAARGKGTVNPNPLVGALIVKDETIISEGYHHVFGGAHAEIEAFKAAAVDVKGCTLFVNLEPCSHTGKTPPCADAIIRSGISSVYIATLDPNPLVAGKGVSRLQEHGIEVHVGAMQQQALELNRVFFKFIKTRRPYVVMKSAMTLDGKIATTTGKSQWITGAEARAYVHDLRNELAGIMVGVNTILKDDPELTCRRDGFGRNPVRIIVDSRLRTPINSRVLQNAESNPVIIAVTKNASSQTIQQVEAMGHTVLVIGEQEGRVDLHELMGELGKRNIDGILLEGGGVLNESALAAGIVDEVQMILAPQMLGGATAASPLMGKGVSELADAYRLGPFDIQLLGLDLLIKAKIVK